MMPWCAGAGRRARAREAHGAAARLLERATALTPSSPIDLPLECDLVDSLFWAGDGGAAMRHAESIRVRAEEAWKIRRKIWEIGGWGGSHGGRLDRVGGERRRHRGLA